MRAQQIASKHRQHLNESIALCCEGVRRGLLEGLRASGLKVCDCSRRHHFDPGCRLPLTHPTCRDAALGNDYSPVYWGSQSRHLGSNALWPQQPQPQSSNAGYVREVSVDRQDLSGGVAGLRLVLAHGCGRRRAAFHQQCTLSAVKYWHLLSCSLQNGTLRCVTTLCVCQTHQVEN
jgi:hypothetical protein